MGGIYREGIWHRGKREIIMEYRHWVRETKIGQIYLVNRQDS